MDALLNSVQDLFVRRRGGDVTAIALVVTSAQEKKAHARILIIRWHQRLEFRAEDRANLSLVWTKFFPILFSTAFTSPAQA